MAILKTELKAYPIFILVFSVGCSNSSADLQSSTDHETETPDTSNGWDSETESGGRQGDTSPDTGGTEDTGDADTDVDGDTDSYSDSDGDTDTDTDADTDTDTDTEIDTDTDVDGDTDADADADSDSDADGDTDSAVDTDDSEIPTTCVTAQKIKTSVGCEFFVADLDQHEQYYSESDEIFSSADPLTYAVVVSNPQTSAPANVRVEDMRGPNNTLRTVPGMSVVLNPGELHVFELTCESGCPLTTTHIEGTGLLEGSAFRVVSDVPVTAYQWNTYGTGIETTDATLLLPVNTLDTLYLGAVWPYTSSADGHDAYTKAYLTVVATADDTVVTFKPTSDIQAGGTVDALLSGVESAPIVLNAFDVVQIAPSAPQADITGTVIRASKPVAVFGGHECAFVPDSDYGSCDHVEEQLLPTGAWGSEAVLARYPARHSRSASSDPPIWRVVAGADGMTVFFDPPLDDIGDSHHFSLSGEVLQFESPYDHYVHAVLDEPTAAGDVEAPFLAYQMMTGRCYPGKTCKPGSGVAYEWGDPMMLLVPPAGQYLDRYVFNTDNKFDFAYDYAVVIRPRGAKVEIECIGLLSDDAFRQVGSSKYEVGRFSLDDLNGSGCVDGTHRLFSNQPVGLLVVGYDFANSYGYLGGVGVRHINPIIVV